MKKRLALLPLLLFVLTVSMGLASCGGEGTTAPETDLTTAIPETTVIPTEGLRYMLNEAGDSYLPRDMGYVEEEHIVIPSEYEGKPVTLYCFGGTLVIESYGK